MQQFLRPPGQRVATAQPLAALPLTDAACPLRASGTRGKRSWSNAPLHPDDLRTIRHGTAVSISQKTQACPKARQNRSKAPITPTSVQQLCTHVQSCDQKRPFLLGPCNRAARRRLRRLTECGIPLAGTARFLFRKTEKKMGGWNGQAANAAGFPRPMGRTPWAAGLPPLRRHRDVPINIPDGSAVPQRRLLLSRIWHSRPPRRSPSERGHASGFCR